MKYLLFSIILLCSATNIFSATENSKKVANISYTLWIGSLAEGNSLRMHNLDMTVDEGISFYEVMTIAQKQNMHYFFKAKESPIGHYITEIGGWHEVPELLYHWMIYKLPIKPNPWKAPSDDYLTPVGVDLVKVQDGDHYLFWFHKLKPYKKSN